MTKCEQCDASYPGCLSADRRCTDQVSILALDTSHLYVLLRMALLLDAVDARARLLALIDAHACHSTRRLVASSYLVDAEITALPEGDRARQLAGYLTSADLETRIELYDDGAWSDLPEQCPDGGLNFGNGDRRWVACAEAAGAALDEDAILVTDDEDLILNMLHCVVEGLTATMPVHTVPLLLRLFDCGVLHVRDLEAMLEAEEARLRDDVLMQDRKRAIKLERLAGAAAKFGLKTA